MSRALVSFLNKHKNEFGQVGVKGRTSESTTLFANEMCVLDWFEQKDWVNANCWVLCIKPNQFSDLSKALHDEFKALAIKPTIISLMAGVSIQSLEKTFPGTHILRLMANLSIANSSPMFAMCANTDNTNIDLVTKFKKTADVIALDEEKMHLATVLLGSGPALFLAVQNKLQGIAKCQGFRQEDALKIAKGALQGASDLMDANQDPNKLIAQIASPGGTTQAALNVVHESGLLALIDDAVVAACKRSIEISDNDKKNENSD